MTVTGSPFNHQANMDRYLATVEQYQANMDRYLATVEQYQATMTQSFQSAYQYPTNPFGYQPTPLVADPPPIHWHRPEETRSDAIIISPSIVREQLAPSNSSAPVEKIMDRSETLRKSHADSSVSAEKPSQQPTERKAFKARPQTLSGRRLTSVQLAHSSILNLKPTVQSEIAPSLQSRSTRTKRSPMNGELPLATNKDSIGNLGVDDNASNNRYGLSLINSLEAGSKSNILSPFGSLEEPRQSRRSDLSFNEYALGHIEEVDDVFEKNTLGHVEVEDDASNGSHPVTPKSDTGILHEFHPGPGLDVNLKSKSSSHQRSRSIAATSSDQRHGYNLRSARAIKRVEKRVRETAEDERDPKALRKY